MKHSITLTALFFLCTIVFAQQKSISKSFTGIKTIKLNTASGDIDIKKAAGNEVKLLVKYSYDDNEYTPVIEQNSSKLTLQEEFSIGKHSSNSSLALEVPDYIPIRLNTRSGDITVGDLTI